MNFKKFIVGAACLAAVLCAPIASANVWLLDSISQPGFITFEDGGTASGSFTADTTGALSDWDIFTWSGVGTGLRNHYNFITGSQVPPNSDLFHFTLCSTGSAGACGAPGEAEFQLTFQDPLDGATSPVLLATNIANDSFEQDGGGSREVTDVAADGNRVVKLQAVPEPGVLALLGLGLAGLGFSRKRT